MLCRVTELLAEFSSSAYMTDTKLSRVKPIPAEVNKPARRALCAGVILGRIAGCHALSIPPGTLKQKLWVTGWAEVRGSFVPCERHLYEKRELPRCVLLQMETTCDLL